MLITTEIDERILREMEYLTKLAHQRTQSTDYKDREEFINLLPENTAFISGITNIVLAFNKLTMWSLLSVYGFLREKTNIISCT